jgi:hypothetical protein
LKSQHKNWTSNLTYCRYARGRGIWPVRLNATLCKSIQKLFHVYNKWWTPDTVGFVWLVCIIRNTLQSGVNDEERCCIAINGYPSAAVNNQESSPSSCGPKVWESNCWLCADWWWHISTCCWWGTLQTAGDVSHQRLRTSIDLDNPLKDCWTIQYCTTDAWSILLQSWCSCFSHN